MAAEKKAVLGLIDRKNTNFFPFMPSRDAIKPLIEKRQPVEEARKRLCVVRKRASLSYFIGRIMTEAAGVECRMLMRPRDGERRLGVITGCWRQFTLIRLHSTAM